MNSEELDKALHDSMNTLWKVYRSDSGKLFDTMRDLHKKYPDATVSDFMTHLCFGLLGAVRRKELMKNEG